MGSNWPPTRPNFKADTDHLAKLHFVKLVTSVGCKQKKLTVVVKRNQIELGLQKCTPLLSWEKVGLTGVR